MRGQQSITRARANGRAITAVFLTDFNEEPCTRQFLDAELALSMSDKSPYAELDTDPSDNPALLDLRCVAGLRVFVNGESEQRVKALMRRAKLFEPTEIIGSGYGAIIRWTRKA